MVSSARFHFGVRKYQSSLYGVSDNSVLSSSRPVVIVGAGMAGLSAAVRLQSQGVPTVLIDRNERPGGKLNLVEDSGYRFDTGPSLVTMPEVFEDLFSAVGIDFGELGLVPLDPYCRYFFPGGEVIETSDSLREMSRTLLRESPEDVEAFFHFLAKAAMWYRMSIDAVIKGPPLDWRRMRRTKLDPIAFFSARPFERFDRLGAKNFRDPRIRRILGLVSLYTGCAPWRTPSIFSLIPFLEMGLGRWYVPGGLYRIAQVLIGRYEALGGRFLPGQTVERVEFESGRARRAVLSTGEDVVGSQFVVNADVALAVKSFLREAPGAGRLNRRLDGMRLSTSAFVLLAGVKSADARLIHHNIFFSSDEGKEWHRVFRDGLPPQDPTVYVNHPSFTDPTVAPAGGAALFLMVNVPADHPVRWDWEREGERYGEHVLSTLENRGVAIRPHLEVLHRRTPVDFQTRTFADGGSLYGRAPESLVAMMRRPRNEESGFEGVVFAGGTTHPGAGIPLAALSGKLAAEMVMARLEKEGR